MGYSSKWNRSAEGGRTETRRSHARLAACAVVGVLFAVAAILVASRMRRGGDRADSVSRTRAERVLIEEAVPQIPTNRPTEAAVQEAKPDMRDLRKKTAALPLREREDMAFEEMKRKPIDLTPKTNRIFRTGIETSMARIFMTKLGDPPPPPFTTAIPLRDEAHLAEILVAGNPVLESDTDEQREAKEIVELAKKEMAAYIKDGGEPEGFLAYYRGKLQEAFETRRESAKEFMRVLREDPDIAGEYLERINGRLAEKGIKTIELTEKQKQRMGIE